MRRVSLISLSLTVVAGCFMSIDLSKLDADRTDSGSGATQGDSGNIGGSGGGTDCAGQNTQISADHCGACNHSCLGGTCVAGTCQPVVLAADQDAPQGLSLSVDEVFFTNWAINTLPGSVAKVSKNGGAVTTLVTDTFGAGSLDVDGSDVFYGEYTTERVSRVSASGGAPHALSSGMATVLDVVVDETDVFFADYDETTPGGLYRVPRDGSAAAVSIKPGVIAMSGVTLRGPYVYYVEVGGGRLVRIDKDGGNELTVITGLANPLKVALGSVNAYVSEYGLSGRISYAPLEGGTRQTLVTGLPHPIGIAVHVDDVYVCNYGPSEGADPDGSIVRVMPNGGVVELVNGIQAPIQLKTDGKALFWTEKARPGGRVMKLAL